MLNELAINHPVIMDKVCKLNGSLLLISFRGIDVYFKVEENKVCCRNASSEKEDASIEIHNLKDAINFILSPRISSDESLRFIGNVEIINKYIDFICCSLQILKLKLQKNRI